MIKLFTGTIGALLAACLVSGLASCGAQMAFDEPVPADAQQLPAPAAGKFGSGLLSGLVAPTISTIVVEPRIQILVQGSTAYITSVEVLSEVVLFTADGRYFTFATTRNAGSFRVPDGTPICNVLASSSRGSKWFLDNARWYQDASRIWYPDSSPLPDLLAQAGSLLESK